MAKTIKFNYRPEIALRYAKEWESQADEQNRKIVQDIITLCEVGLGVLKPKEQ